jgi:hypothetical protein
MFNNRLIAVTGGAKWSRNLASRRQKTQGMLAGCGRCCRQDTLAGEFAGRAATIGHWPSRKPARRHVANRLRKEQAIAASNDQGRKAFHSFSPPCGEKGG